MEVGTLARFLSCCHELSGFFKPFGPMKWYTASILGSAGQKLCYCSVMPACRIFDRTFPKIFAVIVSEHVDIFSQKSVFTPCGLVSFSMSLLQIFPEFTYVQMVFLDIEKFLCAS